jgi:hypothetical protein
MNAIKTYKPEEVVSVEYEEIFRIEKNSSLFKKIPRGRFLTMCHKCVFILNILNYCHRIKCNQSYFIFVPRPLTNIYVEE